MNLCAACMYDERKITDGRYMVKGTSLCRKHLFLATDNQKTKPTSDASKSTLQRESDTGEE